MEFTAVLILVCSIALFAAILYSLWTYAALSSWTNDGLQRGDLYSLIDVASGVRPNGLSDDQACRLRTRGFVRDLDSGHFQATLKGRLALRLRRTARKRAQRTEAKVPRSGERSKV